MKTPAGYTRIEHGPIEVEVTPELLEKVKPDVNAFVEYMGKWDDTSESIWAPGADIGEKDAFLVHGTHSYSLGFWQRERPRDCPHCRGHHNRARSQMRCYGRLLRSLKRTRKIRLIKKVGTIEMTGDVMRRMCFDPGPWAKSWADRIDAELIEHP